MSISNSGIKHGVFYQSSITIVAGYTLDKIMTVFANAVGGNISITVPSAASYDGACYNIKKTDSSSYTITLYAADNIEGLSTKVLRSPNETVSIISNGTTWLVNNSSSSSYLLLSTPADSTNIVLDGTKNVILCNNTGNINVTLPSAASFINKSIIIKKLSTTGTPNAIVTILSNGSEAIDSYTNAGTPLKLYTQYTGYNLLSNGSNWFII